LIKAPEYGSNEKETIQNLMDAVFKMRKELNFILYNLDDKNIPQLAKIIGDIDANHTAIIQTENEISLIAQDVAGVQGQITVLAGEVSLKVSDSDITASLIVSRINGGTVQINAANIDLNGIVRVAQTLKIGETAEYGKIIIGSGVFGAHITASPGSSGDALVVSAANFDVPDSTWVRLGRSDTIGALVGNWTLNGESLSGGTAKFG
jgi:hypothetical protein